MEEKIGDINCEHKWVYDEIVIDTNPPTYHKICSICGRLEHEYDRKPNEMKCCECVYIKADYLTGVSGSGMYQFHYCSRLDSGYYQIVDQGCQRECKGFQNESGKSPEYITRDYYGQNLTL